MIKTHQQLQKKIKTFRGILILFTITVPLFAHWKWPMNIHSPAPLIFGLKYKQPDLISRGLWEFSSHTSYPTGVLPPQTEDHCDSGETARTWCTVFLFGLFFVFSKNKNHWGICRKGLCLGQSPVKVLALSLPLPALATISTQAAFGNALFCYTRHQWTTVFRMPNSISRFKVSSAVSLLRCHTP